MTTYFFRLKKSISKRGVYGFFIQLVYDFYSRCSQKLKEIRDFYSKFEFFGEKTDHDILIIVLAGYKPKLWPITLKRIVNYRPENSTICVVSAGKNDSNLKKFCLENNCNYLAVSKNKTGLAMNIAIRNYKNAKYIYKIDEDIFISRNFFTGLKQSYDYIVAEGTYMPGFIAPILNVNGVSYKNFLEELGILDEYAKEFNEKQVACAGFKIHYDPNSSIWIWKHSLPLTEVSKIFEKRSYQDVEIIPTRFSIGAIFFSKQLWTEMNGFRSSWREGVLGVDEEYLCYACVNLSRPMFMSSHVFCGHFSFNLQEKMMLNNWSKWCELDSNTFYITSEK